MRPTPFILLCSATLSTSSLASVRYVITDTGVIPNASGDVAGWDNT